MAKTPPATRNRARTRRSDSSRSLQLDRYEGQWEDVRVEHGTGESRHETRSAYVERKVGEDEVLVSRASAKRLLIRGVLVGIAGVAVGWGLSGAL